ncbi:MAG: hypothetical protein R2724_06765 [Bryobacterales bacterium]
MKGKNGEKRQISSSLGAMSRNTPPRAPTPTSSGIASHSCGEVKNAAGSAITPPAANPVM